MEKEVRYIQLPPLPENIEMPALEAIWLIARMDREQQLDALRQLEAMTGNEETNEMDYGTVQEILDKYSNLEDDSLFSQYIECFRRLLSGLVLESYDVAAYVYQKRCVEGLNIEEIVKTTRLSEEAVNMFMKYFDVRHNQNN